MQTRIKIEMNECTSQSYSAVLLRIKCVQVIVFAILNIINNYAQKFQYMYLYMRSATNRGNERKMRVKVIMAVIFYGKLQVCVIDT